MSKKIRLIRVEGNVAYIPLTKGETAIIDASDVDIVSGWNWSTWAIAGIANKYAVRVSSNPKKTILMHRAIMSAMHGMEVDHVNGNGLDNRKCNLRIATRSQNAMNSRIAKNNKSGIKGVYWNKKREKWIAKITCERREIYLGEYKKIDDAAEAYKNASAKFHAEFGRTN